MISLKRLIGTAYPDYAGLETVPDVPVRGLECDSRKIEAGSVFVAIRGNKSDGGRFVDEALSRGAIAVVADRAVTAEGPIPFIVVPEARFAASRLASIFYGEPANSLKMVGITGTNGKTTSSYLLEHFLSGQRKKVGVIGTVSVRYGETEIPAEMTTPGPMQIQVLLSRMREASCEYVVMEVSSHALDQYRTSSLDFETALFTNLTQDHLDYHGTLESYFECKARLFLGLSGDRTAVLNADDPWAMQLASRVKSRILTYGIDTDCDFKARHLRFSAFSTDFILLFDKINVPVRMPLVGRHNVYNVLGSLATLKSLGLDVPDAVEALKTFGGVPGRLESVNCGQDFGVFIDFAHTPDGLLNVLKTLKEHQKRKLVAVFGCGGERDRDKRPKMGKIASQYCDYVYLTADNPRSEDPETIAHEIEAGFEPGFKNYEIIADRREAIRRALLAASAGDIVLLAGKGHERTQVIGGTAHPFSEREEARRILGEARTF
jgi:UDP-N-acetylmuramoyl-L-alanyl-D-glutamate--2,6-diaminopimelate ligase